MPTTSAITTTALAASKNSNQVTLCKRQNKEVAPLFLRRESEVKAATPMPCFHKRSSETKDMGMARAEEQRGFS